MSQHELRDHADDSTGGNATNTRVLTELREANERLLFAGLRERELAERLRRQLAFTNAITDNLSEGICALDHDSRITVVNPAATRLLGLTAEELLVRDFHDVVHFHCNGDCLLSTALQAGTTYQNDDDVFVCWNETWHPVAYSVIPIVTHGQINGSIVTFRDISERKRIEIQTGLLARVQTARSEAEASARARTEVLIAVSHDLGQPLTVIKGMAQLLSRRATKLGIPEQDRFVNGLGRIDDSATKMMATTHELLDVARLASGKPLALQRRPTDLVELVRRVAADQDRVTSHHLVFEMAAAPLIGSWDSLRLERVFANILSNATKYSPGDRSVVLKLRHDNAAPDWVVIEIQDQGIGIPETDLPHIFDRFFRGSNVAGQITGIGLGLAGSKAIIEQHGGTIDISSAEGAGTTVTVRLPGVTMRIAPTIERELGTDNGEITSPADDWPPQTA